MYLRRDLIVRLACMKHAASVRPEPGSNSPLSEKFISFTKLPLGYSDLSFVVRAFFVELTSFFVF